MPHGGGTAPIFVRVSDKIVESVIDQFRTRAEQGKRKYGTTMERDDLTFAQWIQHLQEELMDAVVYIEKIKQSD
jgi:hypothetical protein